MSQVQAICVAATFTRRGCGASSGAAAGATIAAAAGVLASWRSVRRCCWRTRPAELTALRVREAASGVELCGL